MRVCILLLLSCSQAFALEESSEAIKNLGVHGHCFNIEEPDLLKQITSKLETFEKEGKLTALNNKILKKTEQALRFPKAVSGITRAKEPRTFTYDPSFTVPYDLKDHKRRVFYKAGTKLNPLETVSLHQSLLFIDGQDEDQIAWIQETQFQETQFQETQFQETHLSSPKVNKAPLPKIILVAGSPFELMERFNHPFYFDQGGRITKKLGIRHVPALVVQEKHHLKISEMVIPETHHKQPLGKTP